MRQAYGSGDIPAHSRRLRACHPTTAERYLHCMSDELMGAACVVCAKPTDPDRRAEVIVKSEQYPDRMYHFAMHTSCLKKVAKPGFVGTSCLKKVAKPGFVGLNQL
jgi:hypothetical protein